MEIGDKVRLLHSREEGIVRRFVDKKTVEIEIEDGFSIPVLINEVVSISSHETERFPDRQNENFKKKEPEIIETLIEKEDIILALESRGMELNLWLINQTNGNILFTVNTLKGNSASGVASGSLKKNEYTKLDCWDLRAQETWPLLIIDLLRFSMQDHEYQPPVSKELRITDKLLVKKPQNIPLVGAKGVYFSILESAIRLDPAALRESFYSDKDTDTEKNRVSKLIDPEVDLHIESLVKNSESLNQHEILDIQLKYFEKKLEEAVIQNADTITFIHGIGNGTLRFKIHKILSQYPHVKYFEDAQKEKFGFGATKIHLK